MVLEGAAGGLGAFRCGQAAEHDVPWACVNCGTEGCQPASDSARPPAAAALARLVIFGLGVAVRVAACDMCTPLPCVQGYKLPFDRHDWTVDRCGRQASVHPHTAHRPQSGHAGVLGLHQGGRHQAHSGFPCAPCFLQVRYVIDFYSGAPQPGAAASMHLDVRPALDSMQALTDRVTMQWRFVSSGAWFEAAGQPR